MRSAELKAISVICPVNAPKGGISELCLKCIGLTTPLYDW